MQKISTLFLFIILFCVNAFGQAPTFEWAKTYGNINDDNIQTVKSDEFGNVYYAGNFHDSLDFDPGPGIQKMYGNYNTLYLVKLNASGEFIWAKHIDATLHSMQVDNDNEILLTGIFAGTCDFDPNSGVQNRSISTFGYSFLLKLDSSGSFKWVYTFRGSYLNSGICITNQNNIVLSGAFAGSGYFSHSYQTSLIGVQDIFLMSISATGVFQNVKTISKPSGNFMLDRSTILNNNIIITGFFNGNNVDFNPGIDSSLQSTGGSNLYSPFILSLDDTFGLNWVRRVEITVGYYDSNFYFKDVTIDSTNNIYLTGYFQGNYDFNTDTGSANIQMANSSIVGTGFVLKIKGNGNFSWAIYFDFIVNNIKTISKNELYISGSFNGYKDFDPSALYENRYAQDVDYYLLCLDTNRTFKWVINFGGPSSDFQYDLFVDKFRSVILAGRFLDSIDLEPSPNIEIWAKSNGSRDVSISKFRQCTPSSSTLSISECSSYTINNRTYTASGLYRILVFNATGCDSTITLTLSIKNTKASITRVGCDSILVNSTWYSKTGTYTQMLTNAANCDSTLTINVSIRNNIGSYAATSCDSIRINNVLYTSSGVYKQTFTNRFGCDSVVTLTITIKSSSFNTLSYTQCDTIRINNILYSLSGTYKQKFTNAAGCDSFLTLNITIHKASQGSKVYTACDSIQINNIKYYKTGYYSQSLTTTHGCDSVLNITLTINKAQVNPNIQNVSGCDSLKIDNITYTQSGNHQHHYTSSTGCDSAVDYTVTIRHASSGSVALTYCRTATINGITYNSSGNYSQHLNNSEGCDSALQINLTLVNADKTVTKNGLLLSANQNGALYQWLDCNSNYAPILNANAQSYTVTQNGQYAVRIKLGTCFDTSQCIPITGVGINNASSGKPVVHITPNPFNQDIRVSIFEINSNQSPIQISLLDAQGRVVATQTSNENNTSDFNTIINTTSLASGIYFIQIKNEGFVSIHKIVKN